MANNAAGADARIPDRGPSGSMPYAIEPPRIDFGVIGHRPNRLPAAARSKVRGEIARVLDALAAAIRARDASQARTEFALVSALAEGADQMTAEAALERGFALVAPLPFAVADYAKDFESGPVRDRFCRFVERAREVVELPGSRANEGRAYEAVGNAVIERVDLLIVVWDGGASAGRGGTTEMILTAARRGVPTVHIDARGRAATRLLEPADDLRLNANAEIENLGTRDFDAGLDWLCDTVLKHHSTVLGGGV
jgi:hypothetical protein